MTSPDARVVYLDGELVALERAKVSVLDRGFLFGDAVYEVIPVFGGRPLRLDAHLARLARSLAAIGIAEPLSRERWREVIEDLVRRHGGGDQIVYLQVTRGVAEREHVLHAPVEPTVLVMSRPGAAPSARPVTAITCEDIRWHRCDIKSTALAANVLLRQRAAARGAYEAILLRHGEVTEGAASNVFAVIDGTVCTPPVSNLLLPGVTRDLVLELATAHGLPQRQAPIDAQALRDAQEIWLTSSTRGILPVVELDGRPVGDGAPGPFWRRAHALYENYKTGTES